MLQYICYHLEGLGPVFKVLFLRFSVHVDVGKVVTSVITGSTHHTDL